MIINVHGGPVERERPRAIGRSNYFRNELGIAIIYPNIRGSSGFGRAFEELDNGLLRENAVKDIGALLDWIAAQPGLDKTRVMIAGPELRRLRRARRRHRVRRPPARRQSGVRHHRLPVASSRSTEMSRQANRNAEYGDPADPGDARLPDAHLAADQRRELEDAGVHRRRRQGHARADLAGRGAGQGAEGEAARRCGTCASRTPATSS